MEKGNMLTQSQLQELKEILKNEYQKDLSLKEVSEVATTLLNFFEALASIYYQQMQSKNKDENNIRKNYK